MSKVTRDGGLALNDLRYALDYSPESGLFRWRFNIRRKGAGDTAGSACPDGYWRICFGRRSYLAHRLAWFYVYGEWPNGDIDHINRNRSDNRIENLRVATRGQNIHYSRPRVNKTSRYKGVHFAKKDKRWIAQIKIDGRGKHLGSFRTEDAASNAYLKAARKLFKDFAYLPDTAIKGPGHTIHNQTFSTVGVFEALLMGATPEKMSRATLDQRLL